MSPSDIAQRPSALPHPLRTSTSHHRTSNASSIYTTHFTYSTPSICTAQYSLAHTTDAKTDILQLQHQYQHDLATFTADEYRLAIQPLLEDLEKWMERQESLDKLNGVRN